MTTATTTRERPILMHARSVRGILADRKGQTRRVICDVPDPTAGHYLEGGGSWSDWTPGEMEDGTWAFHSAFAAPVPIGRCPYGAPGDLLYVRETWGVGTRPCPHEGWRDGIEYRADEAYLEDDRDLLPLYSDLEPPDDWEWDAGRDGWRPSIHMPKWAARIWLELTDVRVERVQDISVEDVWAEGVQIPATPDRRPLMRLTPNAAGKVPASYLPKGRCFPDQPPLTEEEWAISHFADLWDDTNAHRDGCSWEDNPYVWVLSFRRIEP